MDKVFNYYIEYLSIIRRATHYFEKDNFEESIDLYCDAEKYLDRVNMNNSGIIKLYVLMSKTYIELGNLDVALIYLNKAKSVLDIGPSELRISIDNNIAYTYLKKKKYNKSETLYFDLLEEIESNPFGYNYHPLIYNNIGELYFMRKLEVKSLSNYSRALFYFERSIIQKPLYYETLCDNISLLFRNDIDESKRWKWIRSNFIPTLKSGNNSKNIKRVKKNL